MTPRLRGRRLAHTADGCAASHSRYRSRLGRPPWSSHMIRCSSSCVGKSEGGRGRNARAHANPRPHFRWRAARRTSGFVGILHGVEDRIAGGPDSSGDLGVTHAGGRPQEFVLPPVVEAPPSWHFAKWRTPNFGVQPAQSGLDAVSGVALRLSCQCALAEAGLIIEQPTPEDVAQRRAYTRSQKAWYTKITRGLDGIGDRHKRSVDANSDVPPAAFASRPTVGDGRRIRTQHYSAHCVVRLR
jgi:hypothetical protein